jgi:hypothetical protein
VRRVPAWLMVLVAASALALLVACVTVLPVLLYPPLPPTELQAVTGIERRIELQQAQGALQNDARATLLQGLGGLVLVIGAVATWRQVQISREGQITERFTRAVDQIGSKSPDVRIGGIYALQRVANNSAADRATIVRVLGAFVRRHAPWPVGAPDGPQHPTVDVDENLPWLISRLPDVQTAMEVLARRRGSPLDPRLLLSRVDLRGLILTTVAGPGLTSAIVRRANLARAWLPGVRLDRCDLTGTDLRRANLQDARLSGAVLRGTQLQHAKLDKADLRGADLRGAKLSGARLDGANLTGAREDAATVWPDSWDPDRRRAAGIVMDDGADQPLSPDRAQVNTTSSGWE